MVNIFFTKKIFTSQQLLLKNFACQIQAINYSCTVISSINYERGSQKANKLQIIKKKVHTTRIFRPACLFSLLPLKESFSSKEFPHHNWSKSACVYSRSFFAKILTTQVRSIYERARERGRNFTFIPQHKKDTHIKMKCTQPPVA